MLGHGDGTFHLPLAQGGLLADDTKPLAFAELGSTHPDADGPHKAGHRRHRQAGLHEAVAHGRGIEERILGKVAPMVIDSVAGATCRQFQTMGYHQPLLALGRAATLHTIKIGENGTQRPVFLDVTMPRLAIICVHPIFYGSLQTTASSLRKMEHQLLPVLSPVFYAESYIHYLGQLFSIQNYAFSFLGTFQRRDEIASFLRNGLHKLRIKENAREKPSVRSGAHSSRTFSSSDSCQS